MRGFAYARRRQAPLALRRSAGGRHIYRAPRGPDADRFGVLLRAPPVPQRLCAECEEEARRSSRTGMRTEGDVSSTVTTGLAAGGAPMPSGLRHFFEPRFGQDFSSVRLHTNAHAAASAHALNARAYTFGRDIVFNHGEYAPDTADGRRLLAHELTHVLQQGGSSASTTPVTLRRAPITEKEQRRFKLCIDPFYYDDKGKYRWFDPKPNCSDISIPADRKRAWQCVDDFNWSDDGKKWIWTLTPEPDCSDVRLPVPLHEARGATAEALAARAEAERLRKIVDKNRARIDEIRKAAASDVEALAQSFTDTKIVDDGTLVGRVQAIFSATEHGVIPGLQTGVDFGQRGFRTEYLDPWPSSENQVGHFLTAVRLAFDPGVVESNLLVLAILDSWTDSEIPLRLIIGHEKEPDPDVFNISVGFTKQYRATTEEDIRNFKAGKLDKIKVGAGKGNSMADLKLSHKGWILGLWIAQKKINTAAEVAAWIRSELAK